MIPAGLHLFALLSLGLGLVCAGIIAVDEIRRPQAMWIMNVVWPVTALFGSGLALWGYWRHGRTADHRNDGDADPPMLVMAGKAAAHCGSGCTLGDIIAESLVLAVPGLAGWFCWPWLFGVKLFDVWVLAFILDFGFVIR